MTVGQAKNYRLSRRALVVVSSSLGFAAATLLNSGHLDGLVATPAMAQVPAFASAPAAAPSPTCAPELTEKNEALVRAATMTPPGAPGGLDSVTSADYIQHTPDIARFAQLNGLKPNEARDVLAKEAQRLRGNTSMMRPPAPGQPRDNMAYKIIARCDIVIAVSQHWRPDPQHPGKFYDIYFFNMWRIEDGKLAEHWDAKDLPNPLPDYLKTPMSQLASPGSAEPAKTNSDPH